MSAHSEATFADRFWARIDQSAGAHGCWPWTAALDTAGYGQLSRGGRLVRASIVALSFSDGPRATPSTCALHHCDNPKCCNPLHLYWGTKKQNAEDRDRRGHNPSAQLRGRARNPEGVARGVDNGRARLTEADVVRIRSTKMRPCDVVRAFRISHSQATRVVSGAQWSHVGPGEDLSRTVSP